MQLLLEKCLNREYNQRTSLIRQDSQMLDRIPTLLGLFSFLFVFSMVILNRISKLELIIFPLKGI